jgi:hypothetical protein
VGYTYYWHRPLTIPAEIFQAIRSDLERLVLPLADSGVHLAGGLGEGLPVITNDDICFNGVRLCGHPKNDAIVIPYPSDDACGIGSSANAIQDSSDGLITRIKHRCCNGSCSYETFSFPRCLQLDYPRQPDADGLYIEFTKTGFRPYDVAVTAALLIAKRNLKDQFVVHSDGMDLQWSDAKRLCQGVLGYGDWFGIVEEKVEDQLPGQAGTRMVLLRTLIEIHPPTFA